MCAIFNRSIAHGFSARLGVLPSRLNLTTSLQPSRLWQHYHACGFAASIVCLGWLRAVAGAIAAVTPLGSSIVALPVIESSAYAQSVTRAEPSGRFAGFIAEASDRFVVPAWWISAVMQVESAGDEHATSPRRAMGLMQLMPGTWVKLSARYRLGLDPFDPHDNILAGAAYLKEMYDRFGSVGFLAAYHAGPLRYQQHLTAGRPLSPETLAYIAVLAPMLTSEQHGRDVSGAGGVIPWRQSPLFIEHVDAGLTDDRSTPEVQRKVKSMAVQPSGSSTLAPLPADLFVRAPRGPITMTGIAFFRVLRRVAGRPKSGSWVLEGSDRGGQDKSRKVRPVGRLGNVSKFKHAPNIAKLQRSLSFAIGHCSCSVFDTLRRAE